MFIKRKPKTQGQVNKELVKELRSLTKEVSNLKDLEFMKVFKHPFKFMCFSFFKGLMIGFGSVLGASVLVALFIYILAQMSFVPIIGDFVQDVMYQIEGTSPNEKPGENVFIEQYKETKQNIEKN